MKKQGKPQKPQVTTNHTPTSTAPKGIAIEDLIDYRAKGLTVTDIAKLTGCTHGNVSQRLIDANLEGLDKFERHKAKTFEHIQRRALKNITDDELKKASPASKVLMAGVLQDKIMVLRGQATAIIDHRVLTLDLNKAIEQLRQEQGIDALDVDNSVELVVDKCPNGE